MVSKEVEQFGQYGVGRDERKTQCRKGLDTGLVPAIVPVEKGQQRAGVSQSPSDHDLPRASCEPVRGRCSIDLDALQQGYR